MRKKRILLVDNEEPVAKVEQKLLELLGYRVIVQTDSVEALKMFRAMPHHYDVVITDLTMPNLRGDMLAVELLRIRPDIPVILCTGISNTETHTLVKQVGIQAYLLKPVQIRDLSLAVRQVLNLPQHPQPPLTATL